MKNLIQSIQKPVSFALFLAFSFQSLPLSGAASLLLAKPAMAYEVLADDFTQTMLRPVSEPVANTEVKMRVVITGFSSTSDQTDDTPFVTASGKRVHDGTLAANFLKFGTKVKIPEIFGDKVFIVEDRMASRYFHRVDVWFPSREVARKFGKKEAEIVVLEG